MARLFFQYLAIGNMNIGPKVNKNLPKWAQKVDKRLEILKIAKG